MRSRHADARPQQSAMTPLDQMTVGELLGLVASKAPVPGGGAVAGLIAGLGAALGGMVVAYSLGRKTLAAHQPMLEHEAAHLESLRRECLRLGDADAVAYERLNALQRLAPDDPERAMRYAQAVDEAIDVPMRVAGVCGRMMQGLRGLAGASNPHLKSDLAIAGVLALAGAEAARWNVVINLRDVGDESRRAAIRAEVDRMVAQAAALKAELDELCS